MAYLDDCGVNRDSFSTKDSVVGGVTKRIKNFLSGFNGHGWSIWKTSDNKFKAEFDELLIRGSFTVFELIISQIRAIRGSQAITQGNSKIKSVSTYSSGGLGYYRLTIEEEVNSIMAYDFIRCQKGGKMYHVEVSSVGATYIDVKMSEFSSGSNGVVTNPPEAGDEVVQFGNSSSNSAYAKRHSAIYMHVDDGEPAIDFMENIYSKDWSNVVTTRLGGNLPGTNGKRGLYSVNGKIFAVDTSGNKIYEINPDGSGMFGFGAFSFSKDGIVFSKDAKITWNNFIDEYIANGTTIGSKFVASPTGFFGSKGSNGKLTGVLMGKNVTVSGATRTGIFALEDDNPVIELDPITKKYKFQGEIISTKGKIGALTIEGNQLSTTDNNSGIQIGTGTGPGSYGKSLLIGGDKSTIININMTAVSGKLFNGINITNYGSNNTCFKALSQGDSLVFDTYGGMSMTQRQGEKWDVAGPLFAASVSSNGTINGSWGNGIRLHVNLPSDRYDVGKYHINHNLGHTDYYVSVTAFNSNCVGTILAKTDSTIAIGFIRNDNNQFTDTTFEILVMGRNKTV